MSKWEEELQMILKVVFVGDSGVGKTCLLSREVTSNFKDEYTGTLGIDYKCKCYQVGDILVKVHLWDTAGQERFRSIQKPYYRGSHAILLCFSLAQKKSFDNLLRWLTEINNFGIKGQVYLLGCKSDLDSVVPMKQIQTFAKDNNLIYFQTSAKDYKGVNEAFQRIIEETTQANLIMMEQQKKTAKISPQLEQQTPVRKSYC